MGAGLKLIEMNFLPDVYVNVISVMEKDITERH